MGDDSVALSLSQSSVKACTWEHHSALRHVSKKFAFLSETPTEKPERTMVIGDFALTCEINQAFTVTSSTNGFGMYLGLGCWT